MKASIGRISIMLLADLGLMGALALNAHGQGSQSTPPAGLAGTAQGQSQPLQSTPITGSQLSGNPRGLPTLTPTQAAELNARPAPTHVLYYSLFVTLVGLNQLADKREAEGKDGDELRARIQKAAGLTDAEGVTLNEIAEDCMQQLDAVDAERKAIMDARRAQANPPKNLLTMQEFGQFAREQREIVEEHINELKSQLGDASFAKLDAYVRALYKPGVAQPKPGSKPIPRVAPPTNGSQQ